MVRIPEDDEIITKFNDDLDSLDQTGDSKWRDFEIIESYKMLAGDQWDPNTLHTLKKEGRPCITFNRIHPLINQVQGFVMQNKREARYFPTEQTDAEFADTMNTLATWAREHGDYEKAEMQAFKDMEICGVGVTREFVDYDENPDGKIVKKRIFPQNMAWDQGARDVNLRDARWVCNVNFLTEEQVKEKYPEKADEILAATRAARSPFDNAQSSGDNGISTRVTAFGFNEDTNTNKIPIFDYQWWTKEKYHRVNNPLNDPDFPREATDEFGQPIVGVDGVPIPNDNFLNAVRIVNELNIDITQPEWNLEPNEFNELKRRFDELGIELEQSPGIRRITFQAIIAANMVVEKDINARLDGFTYAFMCAYFDEDNKIWFGLTRNLKDPQRVANSSFLKMFETVHSVPKGGVIAEEGVTDNPMEFEQTWLNNQSVAWVKDGKLNAVKDKFTPGVPTGFEEPLAISVQAFRDVTGINIELAGQADSQVSGVLARERRAQGIVALAPLLESYAYYLKESARSLIVWLRELSENVDGRVVRVVGEKGQQFEQLNKDVTLRHYDVDLDDLPLSENERDENFKNLVQLLQLQAVPPELQGQFLLSVLKNSSLKQNDILAFEQALNPEPSQDQLALQQQQEQIQAQEAAKQQAIDDAITQINLATLQENLKASQLANAATQLQMGMLQQETQVDIAQAQVDIAKKQSEIGVNQSKAAVNQSQAQKNTTDAILNNAEVKQTNAETIKTLMESKKIAADALKTKAEAKKTKAQTIEVVKDINTKIIDDITRLRNE